MTRFTFSSTLIPLAGAMLITGAGMAAADDDDMARYIDMFEPAVLANRVGVRA